MRLFIFSSKSWWLTWLTLFLLLLSVFGTYEAILARAGYRSSVTENDDLWAWHRAALHNNDQDIAILGASRIQLGLNTDIMRDYWPDKQIIGLTLNGRYPMKTFEHLANDSNFSGTVIVSLMAQALEPVYWDMQQAYETHYQNSSYYQRLEAWLRANIQHRLRFLNGELNGQALVNHFAATGQYPEPPHVKVLPDLSKQVDYSQQDKTALTRGFVEQKAQNYQDQPPMPNDIWQQQVEKVSQLVEKIHQRGGKVILLRMPTDKGHWQLDEQYYPKDKFWQDLAQIPHVQAIHFQDFPQLSHFALADSSHLDQTDAIAFTRALLPLLSIK